MAANEQLFLRAAAARLTTVTPSLFVFRAAQLSSFFFSSFISSSYFCVLSGRVQIPVLNSLLVVSAVCFLSTWVGVWSVKVCSGSSAMGGKFEAVSFQPDWAGVAFFFFPFSLLKIGNCDQIIKSNQKKKSGEILFVRNPNAGCP